MFNKHQKELISIIDKPLLVNAMSGCGKTRLLIDKINFLLDNGFDKNRILCLSFNDISCDKIQNEFLLKKNVNVNCKTFDSFFFDILEEFYLSKNIIKINFISEEFKKLFFFKNFDDLKLSSIDLTSDKNIIVSELVNSISKLKKNGISLKNLQNVDFSSLPTKIDLFSAFSKYEKYKSENSLIDVEDIYFHILELLEKDPSIIKILNEKIDYLIIDDFQQINKLQFEVFSSIFHINNLSIFTDSLETIINKDSNLIIENLKKFYGDNLIEVSFMDNYRSSEKIIHLVNNCIKNGLDKKHINLNSMANNQGEVYFISTKDDISQKSYLFDKIRDIKKDFPESKIGIICRNNEDIPEIVDFFSKYGVDVSYDYNVDLFQKDLILYLIDIFRFVSSPKESNIELFHILDKLPLRKETIRKIARKSSMVEKSLFNVLFSEGIVDYADEKIIIDNFTKSLENILRVKDGNDLKLLVETILSEFEFYEKSFISGNEDNIYYLNGFLQFLSDYLVFSSSNNLDDFLDFCEVGKAMGFKINRKTFHFSDIEILYIENLTNKEFDHIFITDFNERKFPQVYKNPFFPTPFDIGRDQFYFLELGFFINSVLKAKSNLHIISPKKYINKKLPTEKSRFLSYFDINYVEDYDFSIDNFSLSRKNEIKIDIINRISNLLYDNNFDLAKKDIVLLKNLFGKKDLTSFLMKSEEIHPDLDLYKEKISDNSKDILRINPEEFVFSVSQLQTYETCPRKYLYQYIYKIPTEIKHYFDFGTSMHKVLEELSKVMDKSDYPKEFLFSKGISFMNEYWISKGYISADQEKEYFDKGIKIVSEFIEMELSLRIEDRKTIEQEKNFLIDINGRKIMGIIDRIDSVDGGSYEILDYKTSNSMDRNLSENIQLLVYAMALKNLYGKYPRKMGLWYLIHNKISTVEFDPNNLDRAKKKIISLIEGIEKKDFSPKPSIFGCRFCDFKKVCHKARKD